MASEENFDVDLDNEKVFYDNRWMSRADLAALLGQRLASMDYNIARLSSAIEHLDRTLKTLETFSVKLTPETAAQLKETAHRTGITVGGVIRESVISYLVGVALSKLG
jgi:hypothetical protein